MHSNLHQAQAHDILRSWQSERNVVNHHKDFVLPLFIVNDDEAIEAIESMPGVFRYGCNSAINYLEPLVNRYGLASVLLFPVITHSDSQTLLRARDESSDDGAEPSSSCGPSRSSSSSLSAGGSSRSSSESSLSNDDDRKPAIIPERASSAAGNSNSNNNSGSGKNNPFLNQNEETENLLGPDHQAEQHERAHPLDEQQQQQHTVGSWIPVASQGTPTEIHPPGQLLKVSKSYDVKLIKSIALSDEHNPVLRLVPKLRAKYPGLLIICDVCLCAFTSTGHCCLFEDHNRTKGSGAYTATDGKSQPSHFPIANRLTCHYLAKMSVEYAKRGCDVIAPSDMMDGRVFAIREKLNAMGLDHVAILSYSAKFASQLYGPFRQATDNAPEFGDRRAYQLPPGSRSLALKAVERDISEGADFVMVKPGGPYLDIIRDIKNHHPKVPIAVYQVSGEYAMIIMAAKAGLVDLEQSINESLTSYRRAGATIIITYFTPDILRKMGPLGAI
uniref:Delta-aminolevulinic acid dehydratase n=1 Tax=Aceria tosichella TaxID=561515 RepID=A0A6G1SIY5_9ACAR